MIGLDTATSSFQTLLINKSYRKKTEEAKIKKKCFQLRNKKVQNQILSRKFCQVTHLRDLKSFVGQ